MIDEKLVKHIAHLARIGISEGEVEKFAKELDAILEYVKVLEGANVEGVEPIAHITGRENAMRADDSDETSLPNEDETLLREQAPQIKDGFVMVPRVIE